MSLATILNLKVSYQTNAWSTISKDITIIEVLDIIKNGDLSERINQLREYISKNQLEKYDIHKKGLPAVTFCGTFIGNRRKELLATYNKLIILDIDKLDEIELKRIKLILNNEELVFSFWESPSKKGLKGLVVVAFENEIDKSEVDYYHKIAFNNLKEYFLSKHNIELDISGSDTTRLCFLSHDSTLALKDKIVQFNVLQSEIEHPKTNRNNNISVKNNSTKLSKLHNGDDKNKPTHRKEIQFIIKYLMKQNLSITSNYEDWYRVAFAISNTFTFEVGQKYFLQLSKIDSTKYNEANCKAFLLNAYENSQKKITYKTIQYLASTVGYKLKREEGTEED